MRTRMLLAAMTCLMASPAPAQRIGPRDVDSLPSRSPQLRASYGPDSLQFGELRLPSGAGPFPVAVVIHGGCWTRGFATLRNTAAVASALLDDGIATWNIEYRQVGDPGGGWPGSLLDVGAGVDHVRALAARYPLDLGRVVLVGHSAGAPLALWAAGRSRLAARSSVRGRAPLPVLGAPDRRRRAGVRDGRARERGQRRGVARADRRALRGDRARNAGVAARAPGHPPGVRITVAVTPGRLPTRVRFLCQVDPDLRRRS
jgi:acetyl esterase/lipase